MRQPPLLLFGGTFDPIHRGHIACAQAAAKELNAAEVRLLPAALPPHRAATAAAEHRADMVQLAVAEANENEDTEAPLLQADLRELHRAAETGRPSYTYDTLAEIRRQLGAAQPLCLLLGADALSDLPHWHRWRELSELAHLAALPRPDCPTPAAPRPWQKTQRAADLAGSAAGLFCVLRQTPLLDIAATRIRAALAAGDAASQLSAAVRAYIARHQLYAAAASKNGTTDR